MLPPLHTHSTTSSLANFPTPHSFQCIAQEFVSAEFIHCDLVCMWVISCNHSLVGCLANPTAKLLMCTWKCFICSTILFMKLFVILYLVCTARCLTINFVSTAILDYGCQEGGGFLCHCNDVVSGNYNASKSEWSNQTQRIQLAAINFC